MSLRCSLDAQKCFCWPRQDRQLPKARDDADGLVEKALFFGDLDDLDSPRGPNASRRECSQATGSLCLQRRRKNKLAIFSKTTFSDTLWRQPPPRRTKTTRGVAEEDVVGARNATSARASRCQLAWFPPVARPLDAQGVSLTHTTAHPSRTSHRRQPRAEERVL